MTTENEAQRKEDMLMGLYKFHAYIPNDAIGSPLTPFGNFVEGYNAAKASSEQRIAELEAEVKAYQDEQVAYTMKVVVERTELQAHINRLLKHIKEDIYQPDNSSSLTRSGNSYCTDCGSLIGDGHLPKCILFTTPAQSLKAHDDVIIERCATVCDEQARDWDSDSVIIDFNYPRYCANKIRALKGE